MPRQVEFSIETQWGLRHVRCTLLGPPDADGYVWLGANTKIHEQDLQEAFEAYQGSLSKSED